VPLGCGTLSVKVKLSKPIPQYLPMYGRKIKIYYRGIDKQCTNCYNFGHIKKICVNQKVDWIEYVARFMASNDHIPDALFGKWFDKASEWFESNPDALTPTLTEMQISSKDDDLFADALQSPTDDTNDTKQSQPTLSDDISASQNDPKKRGRKAKTKK